MQSRGIPQKFRRGIVLQASCLVIMGVLFSGCWGDGGGVAVGVFPFWPWGGGFYPAFPLGVFFFVNGDPDTVTPSQEQWVNQVQTGLVARGFNITPLSERNNLAFTASRQFKQSDEQAFQELSYWAQQRQSEIPVHIKAQQQPNQITITVSLSGTEKNATVPQ